MNLFKSICVTALLLCLSGYSYSQCLTGITFTTQDQIDNFAVNNPYCTVVQGNLIIEESVSGNITDLSGLTQIVGVEGSLEVKSNDLLTSLVGLDNIYSVGDKLRILNNPNLATLDLSSLYSVESFLSIVNNDDLANLDMLDALVFVSGYLAIYDNDGLVDITGIRNIRHENVISQNPIVSDFEIHDNPLLAACASTLLCEAIAAASHSFDIQNNASSCASVSEITNSCQSSGTVNICFDTLYNTGFNQPVWSDFINYGRQSIIGDDWLAVYRSMVDNTAAAGSEILFYELQNSTWTNTQNMLTSGSLDAVDMYDMKTDGEQMITAGMSQSVFYPDGDYNTYVQAYERDANTNTWSRQTIFSRFGYSQTVARAAIDSNFAAVGYSDSVFIYQAISNSWTLNFTIPDAVMTTSIAGVDVLLDDVNLVVSGSDETKYYKYNGSTWQYVEDVTTTNASTGGVVDMSEDHLVLCPNGSSSIAYFELLNDSWSNTTDANLPTNFTVSELSLYQDRLFVGGQDSAGVDVVLRYTFDGTMWNLQDVIEDQTPISSPAQYADFGHAISQNADYCLVTDDYLAIFNHDYSYPYGDALLISCFDTSGASGIAEADQCPPSGLTFVRQSQIDSFQLLYPNCPQIPGSVTIKDITAGAIMNLDGLSSVKFIAGDVDIWKNIDLDDLGGLQNLEFVRGRLRVFKNLGMTTISIPSLKSVGGEMWLFENPILERIENMPEFTHLAQALKIYENPSLIDISGLENISHWCIHAEDPDVSDIQIYNNLLLSDCSIQPLCQAIDDGLHICEIYGNGVSCDSIPEVRIKCVAPIDGLDCPTVLDLQGQTLVEGRYKADQTLITDNHIPAGHTLIFQSGSQADVLPGFEVELGAEWLMQIIQCIPE